MQKSIDRVVEGRNLKKYFKGIYGATIDCYNKNQILERMAREHCFDPKKAVFVGDNQRDYECAKNHNMHFVAVINETNNFKDREDIKYKLSDLKRLVEEIDSQTN